MASNETNHSGLPEELLALAGFTLEVVTDMIFWTDATGRILYANPAACRSFGYTSEEMLHLSVFDLVPDFPSSGWPSHWEELKSRGSLTMEAVQQTKTGERRLAEVNVCYVVFEGKEYTSSFSRDISERRAIEEKLRERERWLADSQRAGRIGSYSYNLKADRWVCTEVMNEIFGISKEYPKTLRSFFDLVAPDQRRQVQDYFAGLVVEAGRKPFDLQYKIRRPSDGEERWLHGRGEFYFDENGTPDLLIGAIIDLTELLRIQAALAESEARFFHFMENLPAAAFLKDRDGKVRMENKFLRDLTGQTSWLDKTTEELFPPDVAAKMVTDDKRALEEGLILVQETIVDVNGAKRDFDTYKFPVPLADGKTLLGGIAVETTERNRLHDHLLRSQRLESLGILAGGIAHDFNNILTGILGNLSLAALKLAPGDLPRKYLEESEKAVLRASQLTQQLLSFARGGAPVRKAVDARELVDESVGFALRGSNVRGIVEAPDNLWFIHADEGQVSQLMNNLLINAKQAMPQGGNVRVKLSNETLNGQADRGLPDGPYVGILVEDEGAGIAAQDLPKIFDPYFSTKEGGTGLGLTSAYSIAKRHGGDIEVTSPPGKGASFHVLLPASDRGPVHERAAPRQAASHAGNRILVMDDEKMILDLLSAMLTSLGCEVVTSANGAEAVELYKEALGQERRFDAVILDLTVAGGMGGKEAAAGILALDPKAVLMVSSGYSNDPVMADYRAYGFKASVPKPYTVYRLSSALAELL